MRSRTARLAISVCLAIGLAGCSTTKSAGTKSSWWPPISFKSKKSADMSSALSSNAPSAPSVGGVPSASSATTNGGYAASAPGYYGGTQYPVTPYPAPTAPGYSAGAAAPASSAYMPPTNPYAATAANPYGQGAAANPYASAPPADPYGQPANYAAPQNQAPAYTANGQYGAAPYPGAPAGGAESSYYTR
jgi:hypothetical protein